MAADTKSRTEEISYFASCISWVSHVFIFHILSNFLKKLSLSHSSVTMHFISMNNIMPHHSNHTMPHPSLSSVAFAQINSDNQFYLKFKFIILFFKHCFKMVIWYDIVHDFKMSIDTLSFNMKQRSWEFIIKFWGLIGLVRKQYDI